MNHPNQPFTLYRHLMCSKKKDHYDKNKLHTFSKANKPLVACYALKPCTPSELIITSEQSMWRYRPVLPVEHPENIVSLGEGMTPLISLDSLARQEGINHLWLKDESYNPTGSFKARGLAMAISKAKELGVQRCVIPTAGNAGGAMSAYCAKAGLEALVYMPVQTPKTFSKECEFFGAKVTLVEGNIKDCAAQIKADQLSDCFDVSTLKEPFRLEGKKTMGYEIAEQLDWQTPDVVVYPTGGGTGLIGIWKAYEEMRQMGWVGSKMPRMVAVQTTACYPIVEAFHQQASVATPFVNPAITMANGLRVPSAFGDEMILDILYQSNGQALKVSEEDMLEGTKELAQKEGILVAPEGAAVWMACKRLVNNQWIKAHEKVVLLNTGSIYKYMENF
ncbi:MAG: threonine synthase [Bacteroidota bacterium]